jgi:hypothetical protein
MRSPFVLALVCLGFASVANAQDNAQLQAGGRLLPSLLTRHRLQVCAISDSTTMSIVFTTAVTPLRHHLVGPLA